MTTIWCCKSGGGFGRVLAWLLELSLFDSHSKRSHGCSKSSYKGKLVSGLFGVSKRVSQQTRNSQNGFDHGFSALSSHLLSLAGPFATRICLAKANDGYQTKRYPKMWVAVFR